MKKIYVVGAVIALILAGSTIAIAKNVMTDGMGPAPNAGDCVPDGSGFDSPNGSGNGAGPAPNSGDGISDGPGW
ncbi:MAG: hypothetical protein V1769_05595 [Thermoplasmatota archaeon]